MREDEFSMMKETPRFLEADSAFKRISQAVKGL